MSCSSVYHYFWTSKLHLLDHFQLFAKFVHKLAFFPDFRFDSILKGTIWSNLFSIPIIFFIHLLIPFVDFLNFYSWTSFNFFLLLFIRFINICFFSFSIHELIYLKYLFFYLFLIGLMYLMIFLFLLYSFCW
jgi:hypothetical protein